MKLKKYVCDDCALSLIESGEQIHSGSYYTGCQNNSCNKKAYFHVTEVSHRRNVKQN